MTYVKVLPLLVGNLVAIIPVFAADNEVRVPVNLVSESGVGQNIGTIGVEQIKEGLRFTPHLKGLDPGQHGFHVHEKGSCSAAEKGGKLSAAESAGGHYDPAHTGSHQGPERSGHKGDLPSLQVSSSGEATTPVVAPHLTLADVTGRSLIIHKGGDNYSDTPAPLGGGGSRIACGVVPAR